MSRVGKSPVIVPKDVTVNLAGDEVVIKGKLGELKTLITGDVKVSYSPVEGSADGENQIVVEPANDSTKSRAMWGTTRNNLKNMVEGVAKGFDIRLEIFGVGYKAAVNGNVINLSLGFSHDILYALPEGVTAKCEKPTLLVISGYDKQLVGQIAGEIMGFRPLEPYKGKGVYKEGTKKRIKEGKKK